MLTDCLSIDEFASELIDCLSVDAFASELTNCLSIDEFASERGELKNKKIVCFTLSTIFHGVRMVILIPSSI